MSLYNDLSAVLTPYANRIKNLKRTIEGDDSSSSTIAYVGNKNGYITATQLRIQAASNANNLFVINNLEDYGLSVGDTIEYSARYTSGHIGMIAFCGTEIGTSDISYIGIARYSTEDEIQSVTATIPEGTVSIAFFTRDLSRYTPTIRVISSTSAGIIDKIESIQTSVAKHSEDISDLQGSVSESGGGKYHTYAPKMSFTGKTCYFFGDSITNGYIRGSSSRATNNYPKVFGDLTGASCSNFGVNNACLAEGTAYGSIFDAIKAQTLTDVDYIFIAGGVNDWQVGVSEAALVTAVENICTYLKANYSGTVIFITPIFEAGRVPIATPKQTLKNVRDVITRKAVVNGYYVVQGWEFPFPKEDDDADYIAALFQDQLHPTELGYSVYAHALRNAVAI